MDIDTNGTTAPASSTSDALADIFGNIPAASAPAQNGLSAAAAEVLPVKNELDYLK